MRAHVVVLAGLLLAVAACSGRAIGGSDGSTTRDGAPTDSWPVRLDRGWPPGQPDSRIPPDTWWPQMPDQAVPHYNHSIMILASEQTYQPSPGATPPPGPAKLATLVVNATYPDPIHKPDFIDAPKQPHCVGYRWKAGGAPDRAVSMAGTISVTGHIQTTIGPGVPLPSPIKCVQGKAGPSNIYGYSCSPLPAGVTGASWLGDKTKVIASAAGGVHVPSFGVSGGPPPSTPPLLAAGVDLNHVDPSKGVTIAWDPTHSSLLVLIIIRAALADSSEQAEIWCSQITLIGQKTIPAGALALLPKIQSATPLMIQTQVIGADLDGMNQSWGSYFLAVGRGVWGLSCLTSKGSCW